MSFISSSTSRHDFSTNARNQIIESFRSRCALCMLLVPTVGEVVHILQGSDRTHTCTAEVRDAQSYGVLPRDIRYSHDGQDVSNCIYCCPTCYRFLSKGSGTDSDKALAYFVPCLPLIRVVNRFRNLHPNSDRTFDEILDDVESGSIDLPGQREVVEAFRGCFQLFAPRRSEFDIRMALSTNHYPHPQRILDEEYRVFDATTSSDDICDGHILLYDNSQISKLLWKLHRPTGPFFARYVSAMKGAILSNNSPLSGALHEYMVWVLTHPDVFNRTLSPVEKTEMDNGRIGDPPLTPEPTLLMSQNLADDPLPFPEIGRSTLAPIPEPTPRMEEHENSKKWSFGPHYTSQKISMLFGAEYQPEPWGYRDG